MIDEQSASEETAEQRIEAALEKLWDRGRVKTCLTVPSTGEIRVVKWVVNGQAICCTFCEEDAVATCRHCGNPGCAGHLDRRTRECSDCSP